MTLPFKMTLALLTVSLVAGCKVPGDFCAVQTAPIVFEAATAQAVVRTDRVQAVRIAAQNEYWGRHCKS